MSDTPAPWNQILIWQFRTRVGGPVFTESSGVAPVVHCGGVKLNIGQMNLKMSANKHKWSTEAIKVVKSTE